MIKVKVIGCGGYGGLGIVELLLRHPEAKLQTLVAATETGMPMSDLYPHLKGFCDLRIWGTEDEAAKEPADVVFFATPDGVAAAGTGGGVVGRCHAGSVAWRAGDGKGKGGGGGHPQGRQE